MTFSDWVLVTAPGLALLASLAFIGVYSRLTWRSSRWGRMMMATALAFTLLAFSYLLARLDDTTTLNLWPVHGWGRSIAWWVIAAVYGWKTRQACLARREQRKPLTKEHPHAERTPRE